MEQNKAKGQDTRVAIARLESLRQKWRTERVGEIRK
jgi:hypothetical protein